MKKSLHSLVIVLLLFCSISAAAQNAVGVRNRIPAIEKMIAEEMEKNSIPGLSVAIAMDGHMIYSKGFGYADLENRVPFTPQTVSRIGSISKTFTALAIMKLVEQGKLSLDAEVQTYLPTFPKKSSPVTIRQLLCHQSGIRHYKGNEFLSAVHYSDVESSLAIFKEDPLLHAPGEKFTYTTYGYSLLSRIVEAASGVTFGEYIRANIIAPLGMKETGFDEQSRVVQHRARFYTKQKDGPIENAPQVDLSNKWGGGGMISTVEDLIKYAEAYHGSSLAKTETIKQMFTAQATRDGKPTGYGLGWAIANDQGKRRVEHSGGSTGATSILSKYPDQNLIIAVLVNCDHYGASQIKTRISKLLFENGTPAQ